MKLIEGKHKGAGLQIAIVASRFNEFITQKLLDACIKELIRLGVSSKKITVVWMPGSFEIPRGKLGQSLLFP